ncbi:FG-GAP-like repeat-containing protein [Thermopolyspora sp. NPDC052614]|uniref:FG-GAP-like repeat-containing protein n=1 Tax=Thermopolyspora sp. NPDC052614 TaxID=3155682 RepID=UPI0034476C69
MRENTPTAESTTRPKTSLITGVSAAFGRVPATATLDADHTVLGSVRRAKEPSGRETPPLLSAAFSRGPARRVAIPGRLAPLLLAAVLTACSSPPSPSTGVPEGPPSSAVSSPSASAVPSKSPVRSRDTAHDYNRDGHADLIIGVPEGEVNGKEAGRIEVVYGSPGGPAPGERKTIDLGSAATGGARFGAALAGGDFDEDGYADLAVAAPGGGSAPGTVAVFFGSAQGLSDTAVVLPRPPSVQGFGLRLAAGDFNRDGRHDLAAADYSSLWVTYGGPRTRAGRVTWHNVLRDTAAIGPIAVGDVTGDGYADLAVVYSVDDPADEGTGVVYRGSPDGLSGRMEGTFPGWGVGDVAIADFDGDGFGDIAAGNSFEDAEETTGQIYLSRGSATRLPEGPVHLTIKSPGMPTYPEDTSGFGSALATGDVNGDGYADIAVGADGGQRGTAFVLYGGHNGLSPQGARVFEPKPLGVTDGSVQGFGLQVAVTDLNGDGAAEVAVTTRAPDRVTVLSPGRSNAEVDLNPGKEGEQFGYVLG